MIGKYIYSTISSKSKVEKYQKIIRDAEWDEVKMNISANSKFLDVGCGSGYSLIRASKDLNCIVEGIDSEPGNHGVGRYSKDLVEKIKIKKGIAENLPYEDESFDVVYCSHVLEHIYNEDKALVEMKRVLKHGGVMIIGMPTSNMAILSYFSQVLFTTHIKIYEFIINLFNKKILKSFIKIFRIYSHSYPLARSIWYDLFHYRIATWKKKIQKQFIIRKIIKPCFYPYPDYPQIFNLYKSKYFSSSVFFICNK